MKKIRCLFNVIKSNIINVLWILIFVMIVIILLIVFNNSFSNLIGNLLGIDTKIEVIKLLSIALGGFLLMIQANISNKRVAVTEKGLKQERLKVAIEHLGNDKSTIRLGGLHELYHLAKNAQHLRDTVCDIICSFIRDTTRDEIYRSNNKRSCTTEINAAIELLFNDNTFDNHEKNLSNCFLSGAFFKGAKMTNVNFFGSTLSYCNFHFDILLDVSFTKSFIDGAIFYDVKFRECTFHKVTGIEDSEVFEHIFVDCAFDEAYKTRLENNEKNRKPFYLDLFKVE